VILKAICYKNAMKNILFHNLIREVQSQEQEEICMQSLLLANQQMVLEEIHHSVFILKNKYPYK